MFDGKFYTTLIAIVVATYAICNMNSNKNQVSENFLPQMTYKVDREVAMTKKDAAKGNFLSVPGGLQSMVSENYTNGAARPGSFVQVPGTYQAALSPRFANVDYGAQIRYNMPSQGNMAAPQNPLTFGKMAHENYSANRCAPEEEFEEYFEHQTHPDQRPVGTRAQEEYPDVDDMIPVGNMSSVNDLGETVQPVVYDRFIYANRNSKLRAQGDFIRGDVPVTPAETGWFRPSVVPSIDLQQGAMNVMGGFDNTTAQAMAELISSTSGNTNIGGIDVSTTLKEISTGNALADVKVQSF